MKDIDDLVELQRKNLVARWVRWKVGRLAETKMQRGRSEIAVDGRSDH